MTVFLSIQYKGIKKGVKYLLLPRNSINNRASVLHKPENQGNTRGIYQKLICLQTTSLIFCSLWASTLQYCLQNRWMQPMGPVQKEVWQQMFQQYIVLPHFPLNNLTKELYLNCHKRKSQEFSSSVKNFLQSSWQTTQVSEGKMTQSLLLFFKPVFKVSVM